MIIEVSAPDKAKNLLAEKWEISGVDDRPNMLSLSLASRDEIPDIVRMLVAVEIDLFGMIPRQVNLEEFFMASVENPAQDKHA